MLTKIHERMLREGLIWLHPNKPEYASLPIYFLPWEEREIEEIGSIVRGLQSLPSIPWPRKNCIVAAQEFLMPLIHGGEEQSRTHETIIFYIHAEKADKQVPPIPTIDEFYWLTCLTVVYIKELNRVGCHPSQVCLFRMRAPEGMQYVPIEEGAKRQLGRIETVTGPLSDEIRNRYIRFMTAKSSFDLKEFWNALAPLAGSGSPELQVQPGLATDLLAYLSNILVPCHYVVRSTWPKGFHFGPIKHATLNRQVITIASQQRIVRAMPACERGPITPHSVRSHIRRMWKEAGLDRFKLPEDEGARLALAVTHGVRQILVNEGWVGSKGFEVDGVHHEVILGDLDLKEI